MEVLSKDVHGLQRAVELIHAGGIMLWPSCGVYGLACHAQKREAVEKIYAIKTRDRGKPLPVIANRQTVSRYGQLNELGEILLDMYWPGFLALVVPKKPSIPDFVTAGIQSVALVCPNDVANELSILADAPIAATSANISGEAEVLDPEEAISRFTDQVEGIIEGPIMPGVLNTILDLTRKPPLILREGGIPNAELKKIIPDLHTD